MNDLFISPTKENIEEYIKTWKEREIQAIIDDRYYTSPKEAQKEEYYRFIENDVRTAVEKSGAYDATKMKKNKPILVIEDGPTIDVSDILKPLIGLDKEVLVLAFFDKDGKLIFQYKSEGTASTCGGEEQYGGCLKLLIQNGVFDQVSMMADYHNHPRAITATPSHQDIVQTIRARMFFDLCGIKLIDTGVVTDFDFCSALQGGDETWHEVLLGRYPVPGVMGNLLDKRDELLHYMRIIFPKGW